jgi:ferredoxin like protein
MKTGIEERLYSLRYRAAEQSHLIVRNQEKCLHCPTKPCEHFCPADVYEWQPNSQQLTVAFENCVECGTCRIGCLHDNIEWTYPLGGCGVTYRFG